MAILQKNVTVDSEEFMITQFPATKGIRILKQLIKLVGPAAAEIFKDGDIGQAVAKLVENMDSVDVEALLKELIGSVSKGSMAINFDNEFAGEYAKLLKITREVVEFNFGNVFTALGSSASQ
jgi:hypothetical protein